MRRVLAVAGVVLLGWACGTTVERPWGADGVAWLDTLNQVANDEGVDGMVRFYDPFVVVDDLALGLPGFRWNTFEAASGLFGMVFPGGAQRHIVDEPALLSTDGAVMLAHVDPDVLGNGRWTHVAHVFTPIGSSGIEGEIDLPDISWWTESRSFSPVGPAADALANRWVAAWSGGEAAAVGRLYGAGGRLVDSVAGVEVTGPEAIGALAPSRARWTVASVGTDRSRAVYPYMQDDGRLGGVLVVVEGADGTGCPGRQAVWLMTGERGEIETETRFWSAADARRCLPADDLPDGWWTDRPLPVVTTTTTPHEDLETVTGTVVVGEQQVAVHNGTPALEGLVAWGLGRFEIAGLDVPTVSSVTFTRFADLCGDTRGRAEPIDGLWQLSLCFDEELACGDESCTALDLAAREAILHELAHVWLAEHPEPARRDAFMDHVGLSVWQDTAVAWNQRAVEHAAEAMAWGLLDEPMALLTLGLPSDAHLSEGFEILAGVAPLQPAAP